MVPRWTIKANVLKYLLDAKQGIVWQVDVLQILLIKRAFHGRLAQLVYLESGHDPSDGMHHKHFFSPAGQISFLRGGSVLFRRTRSPTLNLGLGCFYSGVVLRVPSTRPLISSMSLLWEPSRYFDDD